MYKSPSSETQFNIHPSYNMSSTLNTCLPILRYPSHIATLELEELALIVAHTHKMHEQLSCAPTPELMNRALNIACTHEQHEQVATHAVMVAQVTILLDITVPQAIGTFGQCKPPIRGTPLTTTPAPPASTPSPEPLLIPPRADMPFPHDFLQPFATPQPLGPPPYSTLNLPPTYQPQSPTLEMLEHGEIEHPYIPRGEQPYTSPRADWMVNIDNNGTLHEVTIPMG